MNYNRFYEIYYKNIDIPDIGEILHFGKCLLCDNIIYVNVSTKFYIKNNITTYSYDHYCSIHRCVRYKFLFIKITILKYKIIKCLCRPKHLCFNLVKSSDIMKKNKHLIMLCYSDYVRMYYYLCKIFINIDVVLHIIRYLY